MNIERLHGRLLKELMDDIDKNKEDLPKQLVENEAKEMPISFGIKKIRKLEEKSIQK